MQEPAAVLLAAGHVLHFAAEHSASAERVLYSALAEPVSHSAEVHSVKAVPALYSAEECSESEQL